MFAELVLARNGVLDVSHASRATLASLAQLARDHQRPLVSSHGGLSDIPIDNADERAKCATERNLSAKQVRDIASTGGVVGIGLAAEFVGATEPSAWARAVRHAVDSIDAPDPITGAPLRLYNNPYGAVLHGVDHVGLGSDYDGGVTTYTDVANLNQYTRALMCPYNALLTPSCLKHPFTSAEAQKILGGNSLRVLQANLPAN
jgi:membrane dipeptidase